VVQGFYPTRSCVVDDRFYLIEYVLKVPGFCQLLYRWDAFDCWLLGWLITSTFTELEVAAEVRRAKKPTKWDNGNLAKEESLQSKRNTLKKDILR